MRAVLVTDPGVDLARAVAVREVPDPQPGPDEVLIEVTASAMCRTDLQIAAGDLPPHRSPVIPGHQVVGRISAGPADRIGQRVGLCWLAGACGICRFCRAGRENLCEQAAFTGYDVDGGWAQRVVARVDYAFPLPDADDAALAPLLCGGVIGYRSLRVAGIGPDSSGARLGLYGFGASASLAIQVARFWGVHCSVVTRSAAEADRALALGADWAGTYDDALPTRVDAAITFAPAGWVVVRALQDLDRGGIVAINAIHLDPIGPIDYGDLWWERQIRSVANVTRADVTEFLAITGPAGVRTAYEELPLDRAAEGLRRMRDGDVTGAFVLIP
jgi:propanol-preferring alcohol dehydrogenase